MRECEMNFIIISMGNFRVGHGTKYYVLIVLTAIKIMTAVASVLNFTLSE